MNLCHLKEHTKKSVDGKDLRDENSSSTSASLSLFTERNEDKESENSLLE